MINISKNLLIPWCGAFVEQLEATQLIKKKLPRFMEHEVFLLYSQDSIHYWNQYWANSFQFTSHLHPLLLEDPL
jgi:hypothetical protein